MKRFKIAFVALFAVATLGLVFAFTNKPKQINPDTWFMFTGNPDNQASIETPSNYTELTSAPTNPVENRDLLAIKVDYDDEVDAMTGLPKVNIMGSLRSDIRSATDILNSGASPFEMPNRVMLKAE